ncbi:MAG: hypothetical protein HYW05_04925 [Candidatus Diapherotrites archaeon]|nr:hypothetical protein [Candidatus Diapherotrites archaeon]
MSTEENEEVPRRMRRFYRGQAEKAEARPGPAEKTAEKKEIPRKEEPIRPTREMEQLLKEIGRKEEEELIETLYEEEKVKEPERAAEKFRRRKAEKPEREAAEEIYRASREIPEEVAKEETAHAAISEVRRFRERHRRLPTEKEEEKLSENVFEEVKSKFPAEKPGARKKRARERAGEGKKDVAEGEFSIPETAEKKKLSVSELFGIESEEHPELIEQMSEEPESEKGEKKNEESLEEQLKKIAGGPESITKEIETDKNVCPNCGNKSPEIIFCPNCNSAFCAHCAKSVKPYDDIVVYKCPKCNKEFKVQMR